MVTLEGGGGEEGRNLCSQANLLKVLSLACLSEKSSVREKVCVCVCVLVSWVPQETCGIAKWW